VLLYVLLAVNAFFPGEVYSETRFLILLVSGVIFFGVLLFGGARREAVRMAPEWLYLAFLFLIFYTASYIGATDGAAARDSTLLFLAFGFFFPLFLILPVRKEALAYRTARLLVILAFLVSLIGIYQHFFGLEMTYQAVAGIMTFNPELKEYALRRLATGRIFATFALPTTLAAFLAMIFPLHASLFFHPRASRLLRIFAGLSAILVLLALYFTYSYSGVALLAASAFCLIILLRPFRLSKKAWLAGLVLLLAVTVTGLKLIGSERGFALFDFDTSGENPIRLRLLNYQAGGAMIRENPWLGTGPGNFGTAYPRLMYPGSNETRYAHSTPVQLAAEIGLPAFIMASILFLAWFAGITRGGRRLDREKNRGLYYLLIGYYASFLVFFFHNLGDIDFYFPGTALPGLAAAALCTRITGREKDAPPGAAGKGTILAVACALVFFAFMLQQAWISYRGHQFYIRAEQAAHAGDYAGAAALAGKAADRDPANFLNHAARAWYLHRAPGASEKTAEVIAILTEARKRNPDSASVRAQLAEMHLAEGNLLAAWLEAREARRLYPLNAVYETMEKTYTEVFQKELERHRHAP
jgi:O-antigen ligase